MLDSEIRYTAFFVCVNTKIPVILNTRGIKFTNKITMYYRCLVFILNISCHTYRSWNLIMQFSNSFFERRIKNICIIFGI